MTLHALIDCCGLGATHGLAGDMACVHYPELLHSDREVRRDGGDGSVLPGLTTKPGFIGCEKVGVLSRLGTRRIMEDGRPCVCELDELPVASAGVPNRRQRAEFFPCW